jgi:glutathione peroxidase
MLLNLAAQLTQKSRYFNGNASVRLANPAWPTDNRAVTRPDHSAAVASRSRGMSIYGFEAKTIGGTVQPLKAYAGQALLVVNVASKCGFTPQYAGLEQLYRKHRDRGFAVLGFPCDQFGHQEPGDEQQISQFCTLTYEVSFPMFAKINVNGKDAHPLYQYLKQAQPGILGTEAIKWNFTKFLIDRHGEVVGRYAPNDEPKQIEPDLAKLLEQPA